ncbi:MAG: ferrous iron transporter, partial [Caulobacteraceae bacterium]|nr:ferrous iron transporter [Caulobacteraceae bacterium]
MSDIALTPARVALVGNPNCGKTALFNAMTGARQKVANYAGVTVERKEGFATTPGGRRVAILDLPGTYSLRARSPDEAVTRDAVLGRLAGETPPDVVVCVADATNLRLVLRLALELKQVGRPMVLALNMYDIAQRLGLAIDLAVLSREIGAPIVTTVATRKRGIDDLLAQIDDLALGSAIASDNAWREPSSAELRDAHRNAERIMKLAVRAPVRPDTLTGKIDNVLLHPVAGLAILLAVLFLMFQAVFSWAAPVQDLIDQGFQALSHLVAAILPEGLVRSLITDGLISGVGSVMVFLPQILILFLFILILEDCGYMARAAFMLDKLMGGVGLHGRAFIPLLSSFACAIPGVMATRTIDSRNDRLTTILVAPLMTCSARIPVYTLIISAFIPNRSLNGVSLQGLVMFGLYAVGLGSALIISLILKKVFWRSQTEPFMMEMPTYKQPDPLNVGRNLWQRVTIFMNRAGRIILPLTVVVWVLSTFPGAPANATKPAIDYSFAGMLGHLLQPLFAPIGFSWQMAVALIPGMAAREVAVGALGTVYAVSGQLGEGSLATAL